MENLKSFLLVIVIAIILTVIFTWPFASKLNIFYPDFDEYAISGSILSYTRQAIISGKIFTPDFFNGNEFYPQPYTLIYFDIRLMPSLFYTIIYEFTHSYIFSLNLVVFLSFVLSFISSFYALKLLTKNALASIVGAAVYTFNPITFGRFPSHFDLMQKYFLPLVFIYAYKFLTLPGLKNSILFYLFFTLNAFSAIYFQVASIIFLPFFAAPIIVNKIRQKNKEYFKKVLLFGFVGLIFLPIVFYFDSKYLDFSKKEGFTRSVEESSFFSARLIDYISPAKNNFLYGSLVNVLDPYRAPLDRQGGFNYLEHSLFLNIIPITLFILYFIVLRKKKNHKPEYYYPMMVILILAFILSLGPFFVGLNGQSGNFKLPYYYFYKIIPLFKSSRAPARLEFIFYIPFALFVSLGSTYLFNKFKKSSIKLILLAVILAGLAFENFNFIGSVVSFNEKSRFVSNLEKAQLERKEFEFLKNKNTLHLPILFPDYKETYYISWGAITGENLVNGNQASYTARDQVDFIMRLKQSFDQNALKKLLAIGVDFVVIHKDLAGAETGQSDKILELCPEGLVYGKNNVSVIETKKCQIKINYCALNKDFSFTLSSGYIQEYSKSFDLLVVKNNSDCYLPSVYQNRYRGITYPTRDLFGNVSSLQLQLKTPLVIGPFEQIILNSLDSGVVVN